MAVFFIIVLLLIQFYPKVYENNGKNVVSLEINKVHEVPAEVMQVLQTSCYDCHSNQTFYPWYAKIQPINFWLNQHIEEGRNELNFSEFGSYSIRRQYHKLKEITEQINDQEMPLSSYILIHRSASLDQAKKEIIINWANNLRTKFEGTYPADSLIRKKRKAI